MFVVFLTLAIFEEAFCICFIVLEWKSVVLQRFLKSCSPSGVPVRESTLGNKKNFPGYDRGSLHNQVRTLNAYAIFRELHYDHGPPRCPRGTRMVPHGIKIEAPGLTNHNLGYQKAVPFSVSEAQNALRTNIQKPASQPARTHSSREIL